MEKGKDSFKENAFDLLRILAAFQVMFGHMVRHLEFGTALKQFFEILVKISTVIPGKGVIIFFAVSGYLEIHSIENCSLKQYCKKKIARIYPGLWLAFIVNTIIIATYYGLSQRFLDNLIYTVTQATVFQFYTGDWLRGYGVGTPNGALWTISVIIQFYVVGYIFYKKCYQWSWGGWIASIIGMQLVSVIISNSRKLMPEILYKLIGVSLIPYFYIFMIGMFIYRFKEQLLPMIKERIWYLLAIYIIIKLVLMNIVLPISLGVEYDIISASMLSIVTVGIAYKIGTIHFKHEISYGIYIWHMVIINIAVEIIKVNNWSKSDPLKCLLGLLILICTLLVACLSTIFVEKPVRSMIMNQ